MNKEVESVKETQSDAMPENELFEDMEMISPGQMLREARKKIGLSQEQVAEKLNFRLSFVENLENDIFDQSLPATFNRGYLCNYAKLVSVASEDILASYDALGAAQIQRSEMQSFSNLTVKQTEHSRLMWVSYLVIAILIGSTVMWWLQDIKQFPSDVSEFTLGKSDNTQEPVERGLVKSKGEDGNPLVEPAIDNNLLKYLLRQQKLTWHNCISILG